MSLTTRNQLVSPTDVVQLVVQFTDQSGNAVSMDAIPSVYIMSPSGLVIMGPTTQGVMQLGTGKYQFDFTVPYSGPYGVWNDVWVGTSAGVRLQNSLSFVVNFTDVQQINSDGYVSLGDDPGFNYSQVAILNINKLIKALRARLNSSGKSKSVDSYGNIIYVDCDVFSVDVLTTFLVNALTDFNQIPFFTAFTFDDTMMISQFFNILVERATIDALASKALIEKGKQFNITDNGVSFTPPDVSEVMQSQYGTMLSNYWEKVKYIKNSLRPSGIGLGTMSVMGGNNPAFVRLRHLKERQIF